MLQQVAVIISVIFAVDATNGGLFTPGDTNCGTYNQTGSCPAYNTNYRPYVNDTLRLLLERESWLLVAASSNAKDAPPPSETCVTITVTDTKRRSECIFNSFNHTPHTVRRVRIIGYDEHDKMQVHSIGAIHNWPLEDFDKEDYGAYYYSKDYLHMNTMIKSTTCWDPATMKFDTYRFIISNPYYGMTMPNIPHKAQYLLLIGVNARSPSPELHVALLGSRLSDIRDVHLAIVHLEKFRSHARNFMYTYPAYMPRLSIRCAMGHNQPGTIHNTG